MKKIIMIGLVAVMASMFAGCSVSEYYTYQNGKVHSKITGNQYDKEDAKNAIKFIKEKKETEGNDAN